jgi:chromosomal replication initiation ATPase DnaA
MKPIEKNDITHGQQDEINDVIAFAEKTVLIRTGLKVKLFHTAPMSTLEEQCIAPVTMAEVILKSIGLDLETIQDACRKRNVVAARQVITMLLKRYFRCISFGDIGKIFGGQDHTSVSHGYKVAMNRLSSFDQYFLETYNTAQREVEQWVSRREGKYRKLKKSVFSDGEN